MAAEDNRRPISQRSHGWAKWLTRVLVKSGVTPNFISFTSIVFASLAGLCFYAIALATSPGDRVLLGIGAALFCQLRLLANMMDGMVAVEADKASKDGMIWNELPDRFADIAVLVGAGYCVATLGNADGVIIADGRPADASLGWAAAVAAVMTAYVREVSRAAGAPADFSGPMAKPHRMFVMTMAALLAASTPLWFDSTLPNDGTMHGRVIGVALWIVLIGSTFTALNRTRRALRFLNKK